MSHDAYLDYALQPQRLRDLIHSWTGRSETLESKAMDALRALLGEFKMRKKSAALTRKQEFILRYASQLALKLLRYAAIVPAWKCLCSCEYTQFYLLVAMVSVEPIVPPATTEWARNPFVVYHLWMLHANRETTQHLHLKVEHSRLWLEQLLKHVSGTDQGFSAWLSYELGQYAHQHGQTTSALLYLNQSRSILEAFNDETNKCVSLAQVDALLLTLPQSSPSCPVAKVLEDSQIAARYREASASGDDQLQVRLGLKALMEGAFSPEWVEIAQELADILVRTYQAHMPAIILFELAKKGVDAFQLAAIALDKQAIDERYLPWIKSVAVQELLMYAYQLKHDSRRMDMIRKGMGSCCTQKDTLQFLLDHLDIIFEQN